MIEETKCDAVMIARGVLGNPWIIKNTIDYLDGKEIKSISNKEKIEMCLHHLDYLNNLKDEHLAALEIRNHIGWYLKGMKDGNTVKNNIYQTSKIRDIIDILNEFKEGLDE